MSSYNLNHNEIKTIGHFTGYVCVLLGLFMLIPIFCSLIFHDNVIYLNAFIISAAISLGFGLSLFLVFKRKNITKLSLKGSLLFVLSIWGVTACICGLPFYFSGNLSFIDSIFEGMSGITTTGFSLLSFDTYPYSLGLWAALTQWLGGLGIIVLLLVIVPSSVSLKRLYFAEGKTEQMTPNIKHTITIFIKLYLILTSIGILLYLLAGLDLFNAICYTFCGIATGGFSINPSSVNYFNSVIIEFITIIIMLIGSTNFIILYRIIKGNFKNMQKDVELKAMVRIIIVATFFITLSLYFNGFYGSDITVIFRHALFQVVSVMSSTGFSTTNICFWPPFCIYILIILMFIGGSVCSTAGGIKIYNIEILIKSIWWEVQSMLLPKNAVILKKVYHDNKHREISNNAIRTIHIYIIAYVLIFIVSTFLILIYCNDLQTAVLISASALGNTGIGPSYVSVSMPLLIKIVMILDFWVGRIGVWPLLLLLIFGFDMLKKK
ncbi:TrkH family potassium uptake protein [Methanosphaera sp. WGK6]|uniref:TrkH family potassium uptake protein n=1 Tax=Methanosphaera sp. WGK6 TaxID=1561964 RepID=UPI00084CD69F|nr:potassium transporter TrkG [Methanosphaera sp. WGK6]OED29724.1 hypothetical protein NL43_06535 [Methanosphaera sp. WGK6]